MPVQRALLCPPETVAVDTKERWMAALYSVVYCFLTAGRLFFATRTAVRARAGVLVYWARRQHLRSRGLIFGAWSTARKRILACSLRYMFKILQCGPTYNNCKTTKIPLMQ